MRKIRIEKLTREAFSTFGEFYDIINPAGDAMLGEVHEFFPDRIVTGGCGNLAFSPLLVKRPGRMIITEQEYHDMAEELILPLDDDMILHLSPASGGVVATDRARAFLVPRGTLVKLFPGVWHLAPLPATGERLGALIVLPERTYAKDCHLTDLSPDEQFEIVG